MMYPYADDWSNLESTTGDTTWNPDKMSTYFQKFENCQYLSPGASRHGFNGWLSTNRVDESVFLGDAQVLDMLEVSTLILNGFVLIQMNSRQVWKSQLRKLGPMGT